MTLVFRAIAALLAAVSIAACSSGGGSQLPAAAGANADAFGPLVNSQDFKWSVTLFGEKGQPVRASCGDPLQWRVIGGGAGSNDGSAVGTGVPDIAKNGWVATPQSGSQARAYVSCAKAVLFHYRSVVWKKPANAIVSTATVSCPNGYVPISGAGVIAVSPEKVTGSYLNRTTLAFYVTGGAQAVISCGRTANGFSLTGSIATGHPRTVYSACAHGTTAVGGLSGNGNYQQPPYQSYPGGPGKPSNPPPLGWWVQVGASNPGAESWAACVPTKA